MEILQELSDELQKLEYEPVVPIEKIIKNYGYDIFSSKFKGMQHHMACCTNFDQKVVIYNKNLSRQKKLFVLAKELCHIIMKQKNLLNDTNNYLYTTMNDNLYCTNMYENICNMFAMELLIPYKYFIQRNNYDLYNLCEYFGVSRTIMTQRFIQITNVIESLNKESDNAKENILHSQG